MLWQQAGSDSLRGRQLIEALDPYRRVLSRDASLQELLSTIARGRLRVLMASASGPATLKEARSHAKGFGFKAELAELEKLAGRLHRPDDVNAGVIARRRSARARRWRAREEVSRFLRRRAQLGTKAIWELIDWLQNQEGVPEAYRPVLTQLVERAVPDAAARNVLLGRVRAFPALRGDSSKRPSLLRKLSRRVDGARRKLTLPCLKAVDACLRAGEPGLGFDLLRYVLEVDPQNRRAHRGLGHVQRGGRWLRPFDAQRLAQGLTWDARLGWTVMNATERYRSGEYYDVSAKRWVPLVELNRAHALPENPWVVESEHFRVLSTAPPTVNAKLVARLEAFYGQVFRQVALFFTRKGDTRGVRLVFGVASQPSKLVVRFYQDEAQFRRHARPPTSWACGFYSSGRGASFFYGERGQVPIATLQHEIVHQILGELSSGGHPPAWLTEGIAVFLQAAFFDEAGTLVVGPIETRPRIRTYRDNLRRGQSELRLCDVLKFRSHREWDSGDIGANYRAAGAVLYFLMNMDSGRYRGDTVEMLRDAYRGSYRGLPHYFGLTEESLQLLMDRFYRSEA